MTEEKVGKFVDILSGSFNDKKHKRYAKAKTSFLEICHKKQKQTTIYNQTNLKNDGCVLADSMFIYAIDEAVKLRAAHKDSIGPTYFYVNTYPGKMTLANMAHDGSYRRPTWDALKGASHGSGVA